MVETGSNQDYLKFEADKDIKKLIRDGKLNLIFFRKTIVFG